MQLSEFENIYNNVISSELFGCDCSIANIFLYQERYKISSFVKNDTLFRFYETTPNHTGWAFPIPLKPKDSNIDHSDYLKSAIKEIINSGKLRFCYCSENQKNIIDKCISENFPEYKVEWNTFRGDSDYLYLQKNLAELPGKDFQKKRNHISRFYRLHENQWSFKSFPKENIKDDILSVEEKWFSENEGQSNPDLISEYKIIKNAVDNAETLHISGAVLYINNEPSAMCLAAPVSNQTLDVLFEKAVQSAAEDGAYAVINQLFSKSCSSYTYLNREEDLGIEGLRKAKLSWKPEIILDKYYGNLIRI